MTRSTIERPEDGEYLEYYSRYISLVPEGDILATLAKQNQATIALLRGLSEAQGGYRYAPDKWTVKELVAHVCDAERVFAYRAMRFARADETPLAGFDENAYVKNGSFDECSLADIVTGFENVRSSTLSLFTLMSPQASTRRGKANNAEISVRALAYILAGHELHHMNILRTRYLEGVQPS